jgi:hypothetical protein
MPGYTIIKEGLAKAQFDLVPENMPLQAGGKPFSFEVEESENQSDELFVKLFRCLSATTTQSRFFDFSSPGVLKAAVPFFEGVTIFANHRMDVTQWKGYTQKAVWDGKNEPNGVNAQFVLDRVADPNLVRGVETGALRSASATIWFEYKKSHPDLKWFYDHLGEEVEGEIVRFVVTKISNVGEMSIVWEGEDSYAKSFEAGTEEAHETFNHGEDEMKHSAQFLTRFDLSGEPSPEDIEKAILESITGLEAKIAGLEDDAKIGKAHLTKTREKAVTLYKAAKGEAAKESFITNVVEKADLDTAESFVDEYQAAVEDSVPLACPKCGERLSRRSSQASGDGDKKSVDISKYKMP